MRPLRLAHLCAGRNWGGQELRIVESSEWLRARGHTVWIVAPGDAAILAEAVRRGLPTLALSFERSRRLPELLRLLRLLRRERLDLVDCHEKKSARLALWLRLLGTGRIKVVRSRHASGPTSASLSNRLLWRLGCDAAAVTAECIKAQLVDTGLVAAERVFVAAAGVDESRFHAGIDAAALRRELGIPDDHAVVANVGMIRPDKGQREYVQACLELLARHPRLTCIQVGEATAHTADYKAAVLALARSGPHAERLRFLGFQADIERYLALADIVVIASISTEGRTRLVSQCFLMGRNVVATRVGGLPEMVRDGVTGLLCAPGDAAGMAAQVERLLEDPALGRRLRDHAYRYAREHLSLEGMMRGMLGFYCDVRAS
ncbi:MAG TPA: glycosyltransferase family 4 protein [Candidatus Competibacteraceae bacterium]|nr:glycosyltransferase family 4 protein [Candidatus Competibacteraceae bacterium]